MAAGGKNKGTELFPYLRNNQPSVTPSLEKLGESREKAAAAASATNGKSRDTLESALGSARSL